MGKRTDSSDQTGHLTITDTRISSAAVATYATLDQDRATDNRGAWVLHLLPDALSALASRSFSYADAVIAILLAEATVIELMLAEANASKPGGHVWDLINAWRAQLCLPPAELAAEKGTCMECGQPADVQPCGQCPASAECSVCTACADLPPTLTVEPVSPAEGELCPAWCTSAHLSSGDRDHETDVHATVMSREVYSDDPDVPVQLMTSMYATPGDAIYVGVSFGDDKGAELTLTEAEWLSERLAALIRAARTGAAPLPPGR